MPANKFTLKAVDAILQADLGVTSVIRDDVAKLLGSEPRKSCGETEAARIIGVSTTTLFQWRKGEWAKAPHPFFFRCWFTPANEVRYDIDQVEAYAALRQVRSSRECPQPKITTEEVQKFQEVMAQ